MNTIIVKSNGNEVVNANLRFRVYTNNNRPDMFVYETYSEAKQRIEVLKPIFKYTNFKIVVIED